MQVKVLDTKVHGDSGYLEVHVCGIESTSDGENQIVPHTYGISASELERGFGGSLPMFLRDVAIRHQAHCKLHQDTVAGLHAMKGKVIDNV